MNPSKRFKQLSSPNSQLMIPKRKSQTENLNSSMKLDLNNQTSNQLRYLKDKRSLWKWKNKLMRSFKKINKRRAVVIKISIQMLMLRMTSIETSTRPLTWVESLLILCMSQKMNRWKRLNIQKSKFLLKNLLKNRLQRNRNLLLKSRHPQSHSLRLLQGLKDQHHLLENHHHL